MIQRPEKQMAGHRRRRPADQKPALPDQKEQPENERRCEPDTQSDQKDAAHVQMEGKNLAQRRTRPSYTTRQIQTEKSKNQVIPRFTIRSATGPTCGPGFYIPENPLGTLGAVIPLLAALGLVIASKKNMITITVQK